MLWNIIYYYENLVNYYSHYYTYFVITCCPKNTLICKLDVVYRYIVFLQKEKWYIESFCYNIVENHLYTKFEKKKILKTKNVLVI